MTPSADQERRFCDSVSTRTSWPRRSSSRFKFFTEVTTPFTAGVYQSEVIKIFIAGSSPVCSLPDGRAAIPYPQYTAAV